MKARAFLLFAVALAASIGVASADPPVVLLDWIDGVCPPGLGWSIEPNSPSSNDIIHFTGYIDTVSNPPCAEAIFGTPSLVVDCVTSVIELQFSGDPNAFCPWYWDPVYGYLEGEFGPLAPGDWLFFCNHPGSTFSIPISVSSSLEVLGPDGGEALLAGSTHTIRWADFTVASCSGDYLLEYSSNNGQNWIPVDADPVSCTCSYDWLVPSLNSNRCLIRVVDARDPNICDASDAPFTIYECTLTTDLNNDCYIDLYDLEILTGLWLVNANPINSNAIIRDGVEYYMQTDKSVYGLGENAEMLYTVTNLSYGPVTFEFAYIQQCSFEVRRFATIVWAWPINFNPALSSFTLRPGEFKQFSRAWNTRNLDTGGLVTPGYYDVTGVLRFPSDPRRYVPVSAQIEITAGPPCADRRQLGDLDGRCLIDFQDFAALASDWLRCGNPFDPGCVP